MIEQEEEGEEGDSDDFNPDGDEAPKSPQNGDRTLSAEEIVKMYEDKIIDEDEPSEQDPGSKAGEQTLFPENEIIVQMLNESDKQNMKDVNQLMKTEIERLSEVVKEKDKKISENDDIMMEKDIEL